MDVPGTARIAAAADRFVHYAVAGDRARLVLVVGVPLLFWFAVELAANLGFLPVVLAAALCASLYTRNSVRDTAAASATGTGLLSIGLYLFQAYRTAAGGSTEPLADALVRLAGWLLVGVLLVAFGLWQRESES